MEEEEHGEYSGTSQQDTCLEWWYGWRERERDWKKNSINITKENLVYYVMYREVE